MFYFLTPKNMHYLYFVVFNQEDAETSRQALKTASDILWQENFCVPIGFFGGKAEHFTAGGRWSGILQLLKLGIDSKDFEDLSDEEKQNFWEKRGGTGTFPDLRKNSSGYEGCDDDAMIVDQPLYQKLREKYPEVEVFNIVCYQEDIFANFEPENILGKWIVLIDYQS